MVVVVVVVVADAHLTVAIAREGEAGTALAHPASRKLTLPRRSRSRSPGYIERMRERRRNRKYARRASLRLHALNMYRSNFDVAPPGAPARAVAPTLMQGADMSAQSAIAGVPSVVRISNCAWFCFADLPFRRLGMPVECTSAESNKASRSKKLDR